MTLLCCIFAVSGSPSSKDAASEHDLPTELRSTFPCETIQSPEMMGLVSSDPDAYVRKIKAMRELGATAILIKNLSGRDPDAPDLRRVAAPEAARASS